MKNLLSYLLCTGVLIIPAAQADVDFNGFASLYGGVTSNNTNLDDYTDEFSFAEDSLFALQATADLGDGLSAVAQIVSRGERDWDMDMEWAYLSYQVNDRWRINAGRMRVPYFAYSDYIDVGYAYPWVSPPTSVYDLPSDQYDGVSVSYSRYIGKWEVNAEVIGGTNSQSLTLVGLPTKASLHPITGGTLTAAHQHWQWRASYYQADATLTLGALDDLVAAWQQTPYPEVAEAIGLEDERLRFIGAGGRYDDGQWLVVGEYTFVDWGDTLFPDDARSYFITTGYRHHNTLFHITYGGNDETSSFEAMQIVGDDAPPALIALRAATSKAADTFVFDNHYWQLGVRYDFHEAAALKLEWKHAIDHNSDARGELFRLGVSVMF